MSRPTLPVIIIFIAATAIVLFLTFTLRPNKTPSYSTTSQSTIATSKNTKTVSLPVSLTDPTLRWAVLSLGFQGKVVDIRNTSEGNEIVTTVTGEGLPSFIATSNTQFMFNDLGKFSPASFSDLKAGQTITLHTNYNIQTKKWQTSEIEIIIPKQQSSSTSPASKK